MKKKINIPYSAWLNRLFALKYLCVLPGRTPLEVEYVTYPRRASPFIYLIQLFKKLEVKVGNVGITSDPDARHRYQGLMGKVYDYDKALHDKAINCQLTQDDLDVILAEIKNESELHLDLSNNLSFTSNWEKHRNQFQAELKELITPYVQGQVLPRATDYRANSYAYKHQKDNFLKNIAGYIDKYGSEFTLRELNDSKVFSKDTSKISFLPSLIALEAENIIEIRDIEVHDPETYGLKGEDSDLVAMIAVDESKVERGDATSNIPQINLIVCGKLSYDLNKCQLKYANKAKTITPESREIKFLRCLYGRAGMVVKYKDIARDVNLQGYRYYHDDCGESHEEIDNQALSDDVAMLRRDFRAIATSLGMPDKEFKKLITNITKRGYVLNL